MIFCVFIKIEIIFLLFFENLSVLNLKKIWRMVLNHFIFFCLKII